MNNNNKEKENKRVHIGNVVALQVHVSNWFFKVLFSTLSKQKNEPYNCDFVDVLKHNLVLTVFL